MHVVRRQQPDAVSEGLELTRPMMGGPTGLEQDRGRRLLRQVLEEPLARQPAFGIHSARLVRHRDLKYGRTAFLFPIKALATVFRAKYLDGLRRAFDTGALTVAAGTASLAAPAAFAAFVRQLRAVPWVVYAKPPFAGPEQVLAYLGRYTHRVALSNDRLIDQHDGQVCFRWRDYADHDRVKVMTLGVDEFLRRFLLHVVPRGFVRIRHFGVLANRTRRAALARCRVLLDTPPPVEIGPESVPALVLRLTGLDLAACPVCGAHALRRTVLAPSPPPDSS